MAPTTFHRIFGLLVLLAVGLLSVETSGAIASEKVTFPNVQFSIEAPDHISIQSNGSEKSVCLHATERSHETCPACSVSFVMSVTHRFRPKLSAPKRKTGKFSISEIQNLLACGSGATSLGTANRSLSRANVSGINIFASTGRLRI